ncbi:hypothetical protein HNV11_14505 [Spirosoma taeanense]|uniref:Prolyl-tRNA synthetase n=1 Tax=Spirosoma taeanense TaxID=2735870 RepID=A0A6M5YB86_9BACT|nr:hypothetical protein [Spirosoma taeanense]QJW90503.1 hypothetical protein HNV11_14505 [Spirosoma taeanense]
MKTQRLYRYLTLAALMGFWSCSSSLQTAQNAGETDDLYGNSGNAEVYASNSSDPSSVAARPSRQQQRAYRNANPDYTDEQQGYSANTDEYYTELSARKLNRGLSADPGWSDVGTNAYNSGFVNGYNAASTSAYSWNRWGFNNTGFYNGLGLGLGLSTFGYGYNSFSFGLGNPFYSPFYNSYAYSPFGYGYSPFGYGGFGSYYDPFYAYNSFYSPFYSPFYGGFGRPAYYNNVVVSGADPYRRTYNSRYDRSSGRYNDGFVNAPRSNDPNSGGRRYNGSGTSTANSSDPYYARPRQNSSRGGYYYDNGTASGGRSGSFNNAPSTAPSYNSNSTSSSDYYVRPRQNSRGSYSPSNDGYSGSRGSYQQPSYQQRTQPTYQQPTYQQPSYQSQSRGSSPSYSAPSSSGGYSGGSSSSGGGSSRGPR